MSCLRLYLLLICHTLDIYMLPCIRLYMPQQPKYSTNILPPLYAALYMLPTESWTYMEHNKRRQKLTELNWNKNSTKTEHKTGGMTCLQWLQWNLHHLGTLCSCKATRGWDRCPRCTGASPPGWCSYVCLCNPRTPLQKICKLGSWPKHWNWPVILYWQSTTLVMLWQSPLLQRNWPSSPSHSPSRLQFLVMTRLNVGKRPKRCGYAHIFRNKYFMMNLVFIWYLECIVDFLGFASIF